MIQKERMTATIDGDFVVFLIGMRINEVWKIHKWLPVVFAMSRMLKELYANPEMGFLSHEIGIGRTLTIIQYWRSTEQLMTYAKNRDAEHLPAWKDFSRKIGTSGTVGIWHETYAVPAGAYETVYFNMPPYGLGKAGSLQKATGRYESAAGRLGKE